MDDNQPVKSKLRKVRKALKKGAEKKKKGSNYE
jgi:hypothetical protein